MNKLLTLCAFVSLALAAVACGAAPDVDTTVPSDVTDADRGFVAGAFCNHHVGEPLHNLTVTLLDERGFVTESNIVSDSGEFKIAASVGENTVNVRAAGYSKSFRVTVELGHTSVIEDDSDSCP